MPQPLQIFFLLFLMIGPFKMIVPFAKMTRGAEPAMIRRVALLGTAYASVTLVVAGLLGENILRNYGIPIPILSLAGGLILFLVALTNVLQQFAPPAPPDAAPQPLTTAMAISPLAFPNIITPYGIAAVIVIPAVCTEINCRLTVYGIIVGIMVLNLVTLLTTRYIFKYLILVLPVLGAILGVVQVALGLQIMYNAIQKLLAM
jgi:multiple antibiotic resistance protein